MRSFVSKPVQILGKQFDGTRESAKEITDWIKRDHNARYNSAELHEAVSKFGFDSQVPHDVDHTQSLTVYADWGQLYVTAGDWVVLYVDEGLYSTMSNGRLYENYAEL